MDECASTRQALAKGFQQYRKVFIALGDETRQLIFLTLLEQEQTGMRVPDITARTHLSRPAVSHHLKLLREAGLVGMHRVGTRNYYYVDANEGCWCGLNQLVSSVSAVVRRAAEAGYPGWQDEA